MKYSVPLLLLAVSNGAMASTYTCDTSSDCPDTITLEAGQTLECNGVDACKGKTITHNGASDSTYYVNCYGKDSCENTSVQLTSKTEIQCLGGGSCGDMTIGSDIGTIYIAGREAFDAAVVESGFHVNEYIIEGEDGFEEATSDLATENTFSGQQGGIRATVRSNGKDVSATFAGYKSADFTYLYCEDGSTCEITCYDCSRGYFIATGTDTKLKVNCVYENKSCNNLNISVESDDQLEVTGDGKDDYSKWTDLTRRLSQTDDDVTPKPKRGRNLRASRNLGTTYCEGLEECANEVFSSSENTLWCEGTKACMRSEIPESLGVKYFYASGYKSGSAITVTSTKVVGSGAKALVNADITTETAYFRAQESGKKSTIHALGDSLTVYAEAVLSLNGATIICEQGETCNLNCNGYRACEGATLECKTQGSCTQSCDDFSGCAEVV